jgi:hypothetical protein
VKPIEMNKITFDELFAQARQRLSSRPPARTGPPGCLLFARARALALNPDRWTASEQEHVAGCRRCARLVRDFERNMPHLSFWLLVRRRLGTLAGAEQRLVNYHLENGECRHCRARAASLEGQLDALVRAPGPFLLPHPAAAGAATPMLDVLARSADDHLEAELMREENQITLEVRTRLERLNHYLVGYALRGGQGEVVEGFTVLAPDVEGWYTGHAVYPVGDLYARLSGICEEVLVGPVHASMLTGEEREALLASAAGSRENDRMRAAWAAWLTACAARDLSPDMRELLHELRIQLEE